MKIKLLVSTYLLFSLSIIVPIESSYALECLLDTNFDGNADTNVDTIAFSNSGGGTVSIACGGGARTSSTGTAIGTSAFADAVNSIAIGRDGNVSAGAENGIAMGRLAIADDVNTIAMGASSFSASPGSLSFGVSARARGTGAIALGIGADVGTGLGGTMVTAARSIAIGLDSFAGGLNSIAIGPDSSSPQTSPIGGGNISMGRFAIASAVGAISLGNESGASGIRSVSLGFSAGAISESSIAIGAHSDAGSVASRIGTPGAIAIGSDTNSDQSGAQALAIHSIALGSEAQVDAAADGGIAIGGDVDGDGVGAQSTAPNALAFGADVVANTADTAFFGTAVRITRDDSANLHVENTSALSATRNLISLKNSGNTRILFENTNAATEWAIFNAGNSFRISRLGTGSAELRLNSNGTLKLTGNSQAVNHINTSSRTLKTGFSPINNREILDKVTQLPISTWRYKTQLEDQHIGPMAEDFQDIFNLGDGEHISTVDTAGITLAAVQGLKQISDERDQSISMLESANAQLKQQNTQLSSELNQLKQMVNTLIALNPQLKTN